MRIIIILVLVSLVATGVMAQKFGLEDFSEEEIEQLVTEWEEFYRKIEEDLLVAMDLKKEEADTEQLSVEDKALMAWTLREFGEEPLFEGTTDLHLFVTALYGMYLVRLEEELEKQHPDNIPLISSVSEYDKFALWTDCKSLLPRYSMNNRTFIDTNEADNEFEESVIAAVESRVRGTRLYPLQLDDKNNKKAYTFQPLDIIVSRGEGRIFSIDIRLAKPLLDPITGLRNHTITTGGNYNIFGTASPEYIRNTLADTLDRFLADYLRVNADSC